MTPFALELSVIFARLSSCLLCLVVFVFVLLWILFLISKLPDASDV